MLLSADKKSTCTLVKVRDFPFSSLKSLVGYKEKLLKKPIKYFAYLEHLVPTTIGACNCNLTRWKLILRGLKSTISQQYWKTTQNKYHGLNCGWIQGAVDSCHPIIFFKFHKLILHYHRVI